MATDNGRGSIPWRDTGNLFRPPSLLLLRTWSLPFT